MKLFFFSRRFCQCNERRSNDYFYVHSDSCITDLRSHKGKVHGIRIVPSDSLRFSQSYFYLHGIYNRFHFYHYDVFFPGEPSFDDTVRLSHVHRDCLYCDIRITLLSFSRIAVGQPGPLSFVYRYVSSFFVRNQEMARISNLKRAFLFGAQTKWCVALECTSAILFKPNREAKCRCQPTFLSFHVHLKRFLFGDAI